MVRRTASRAASRAAAAVCLFSGEERSRRPAATTRSTCASTAAFVAARVPSRGASCAAWLIGCGVWVCGCGRLSVREWARLGQGSS